MTVIPRYFALRSAIVRARVPSISDSKLPSTISYGYRFSRRAPSDMMDIGRRCFHFALFGLTRTIMTEQYGYERYESPARSSPGSSCLTPKAPEAIHIDARPAARAQSV